jgi:hypothetical protein
MDFWLSPRGEGSGWADIGFAGKDYPPTSFAMLYGCLAASAVTPLI